MPELSDNDVWFYQQMLERFISVSTNPEGVGRYQFMVRVLGAQARRANRKDDGA